MAFTELAGGVTYIGQSNCAQQLLDFFNAQGNAVQTTLGQTLAV